MFDQLSGKLKSVFDKISARGRLSETDVDEALRGIRLALLEADVALPAIKAFMADVRAQAVGEAVLKSIKPGEQMVKIVHDGLVNVLGAAEELNLKAQPPVVILMAGLQGSGKTTTTAKLAKYLTEKQRKKILVASLDVYRPAAQEQLEVMAKRAGVTSLEIIASQKPLEITKRALKEAKTGGFDVLFLDTAGRTELDATMMEELHSIKKAANPTETLLVADGLTGQSAVEIAEAFHSKVTTTGLVLTRMDGDGRGGAALSMRHVTGCPIKFLGTGEGLEGLTPFDPQRLAGRILDMGDIVEMVEKAQEAISEEDAAQMQEKMFSGKFNLLDLKKQMQAMQKMGSLSDLMGMMPGMGKMKDKIDPSKLDDKLITHQIAMIDSMTPLERRNPQVLNAKRRRRIAAGAGVSVNDVNKLIKSFTQMQGAMKKLKKMGGLGSLMGMMKGKKGLPF